MKKIGNILWFLNRNYTQGIAETIASTWCSRI